MSIQSQIARITNNISDAYEALEQKGATIPTSKTSDNLASTVNTIAESIKIDETLTLGGYAADAKITGDKISNIESVLDEGWVNFKDLNGNATELPYLHWIE